MYIYTKARHVILADKTKGTNFLYQDTMAFICKYVGIINVLCEDFL